MTSDAPMGITEAAAYLGYSVGYLYKLTSSKDIPCNKPRGTLRFYRSELDEWIKSGRVPTNAEVRGQADELLRRKRRGA